jgi:uncharacterized protein (TIGR00255 family)
MTVYSMTGYASAAAAGGEGTPGSTALHVELRSVNGRFLDLAFRMPEEWRALETPLREMMAAAFRRGKIELRLASAREADTGWPDPSAQTLQELAALQARVQQHLPQARPLSVTEAMNWCRSAASSGAGGECDERALAAAARAIEGLREARAREGAKLVAMLRDRIARLRELARQAEPLVPAVVQRQQQRFLERWQEALKSADANAAVSAEAQQERALSEAAALALRIDVAEELSRLGAHLDEIDRLLTKGGEQGKRLDFLIQELHREANTLGSKSAALELSGISVEMKVLVEQMREQVQNIE